MYFYYFIDKFARHIFILLLYLTLIFVISEFRDLFDKFTIKSLLTKDLKIILKYRGIKYKSIFEKQELISLIKETGEVTKYEYDSAKTYHENEGKCDLTSVKIITNYREFVELYNDSKDGAWILKIISPKSYVSYSDDDNKKLKDVWCHIQSIYGKYGISMAVLDCELLNNLCKDRGFRRSPFVLILSRGRVKTLDYIDYFVFPYSTEILKENINSVKNKIVEWLRRKIAHRINQESQIRDFPVHFVSIYSNNKSLVEQIPTSISAHSVKLTGRIHFWSGTLNSIPKEFKGSINRAFPNWTPPGHFFINNNDLIYRYGIKKGQSINYDALQLFFRDLYPNSRDVFIWGLFTINIIISLHVALKNISIASKLGYFIWYFIIFNIIYCIIFLLLSSEALNYFPQFLSFIWQKIVICSFFEHLRYLQFNQKLNFHLCTVVWMLLIYTIVYRCQQPEQPEMKWTSEESEQLTNEIVLITSLGNINLSEQRPRLFSTKLFNWTSISQDRELQWPPEYIVTEECCICLNTFRQNEMLCGLPCKHAFHEGCIKQWLIGNETCPQCNQPTSEENSITFQVIIKINELQWPPGYIFTEECCICKGNFQQNEMLCGLPCGHAFHDCCINNWLIEDESCPECGQPIY